MTLCHCQLLMQRSGQTPWRTQGDVRPGLDAELICDLTKADEELSLEWSAPEEPARSLLFLVAHILFVSHLRASQKTKFMMN